MTAWVLRAPADVKAARRGLAAPRNPSGGSAPPPRPLFMRLRALLGVPVDAALRRPR